MELKLKKSYKSQQESHFLRRRAKQTFLQLFFKDLFISLEIGVTD